MRDARGFEDERLHLATGGRSPRIDARIKRRTCHGARPNYSAGMGRVLTLRPRDRGNQKRARLNDSESWRPDHILKRAGRLTAAEFEEDEGT